MNPERRTARRIAIPYRAWILAICLAFSSFSLPAQDRPVADIADDSRLRAALVSTWFTEAPARLLDRPAALHTLPDGSAVELRLERGPEELFIVLARERNGTFPSWSQGSWVLYRSLKDGRPVKIRIFLRSDPSAYVQFWPSEKGRSLMDLVVQDGYLYRSLPVAMSFDALLSAPVKDALSSIGRNFPYGYFDIDPRTYTETSDLVSRIRAGLPGLRYVDDGAFDQDGKPVFIATLNPQTDAAGVNCSGFAKWVVDGLLRPFTGTRLAVPPLKLPSGDRGSSFTLPFEALRDPFFGLDWTRNLAVAAASVLRSSFNGRLDELEIRSSPISSVVMRSGVQRWVRPYPPYLKDAGFGAEGLRSLLYHQAVSEPGWFYLASVNTVMGNAPRMRQHFHVAVLIPYFDEKGAFQTAVFESAAETSLAAFVGRYPGHHVNLVRIPVERNFDP